MKKTEEIATWNNSWPAFIFGILMTTSILICDKRWLPDLLPGLGGMLMIVGYFLLPWLFLARMKERPSIGDLTITYIVMLLGLPLLHDLIVYLFSDGNSYVVFSNDGPYGAMIHDDQAMPGYLLSKWESSNYIGSADLPAPPNLTTVFRVMCFVPSAMIFIICFVILSGYFTVINLFYPERNWLANYAKIMAGLTYAGLIVSLITEIFLSTNDRFYFYWGWGATWFYVLIFPYLASLFLYSAVKGQI